MKQSVEQCHAASTGSRRQIGETITNVSTSLINLGHTLASYALPANFHSPSHSAPTCTSGTGTGWAVEGMVEPVTQPVAMTVTEKPVPASTVTMTRGEGECWTLSSSSHSPPYHTNHSNLTNSTSSPYYDFDTQQTQDDEAFARQLAEADEAEERERRAREEQEQREFAALLAAETTCQVCGQQCPDGIIEVSHQCSHHACRKCLKAHLLSSSSNFLQCLITRCQSPLTVSVQRLVLSQAEIDELERRSLQSAMKSNHSFIECPSCHQHYEAVESTNKITLRGTNNTVFINGEELSAEHASHRETKRFLCPSCNTDFCRDCSMTPYHNRYTCREFEDYKNAPKCRFCSEAIKVTSTNTATSSRSLPLFGKRRSQSKSSPPVCDKEDCQSRLRESCGKTLSCGHYCCGIKKEKQCLGCLVTECSQNYYRLDGEDYCNICFVEGLSHAPSIKLVCGHVFHSHCLRTRIEKKWTGLRMVFSYLDCPLCKQPIQHPALVSTLAMHRELQASVQSKALQRLDFEGCAHDPPLQKGGKYEGRKEAYAMDRFAYYECSQCHQPYFGGRRACEGLEGEMEPIANANNANGANGALANNAAADLVCGACQMKKSGDSGCPKHGGEYQEFKCKYCCNVSTFFCWGTTHFCDACHSKQEKGDYVTRKPVTELPQCQGGLNCPLKVHSHPANGTAEFALGCAICRQRHF